MTDQPAPQSVQVTLPVARRSNSAAQFLTVLITLGALAAWLFVGWQPAVVLFLFALVVENYPA